MTTFNYDLNQSRQKEQLLVQQLIKHGFAATSTADKEEFSDYDVIAYKTTGDTQSMTFEVKFDRKANTTGNVAVEVCKNVNGKRQPSGLTATKANYQAYTFDGSTFHLISTAALGQMVITKQYKTVLNCGDRMSSICVLFDKEIFMKSCTNFNLN